MCTMHLHKIPFSGKISILLAQKGDLDLSLMAGHFTPYNYFPDYTCIPNLVQVFFRNQRKLVLYNCIFTVKNCNATGGSFQEKKKIQPDDRSLLARVIRFDFVKKSSKVIALLNFGKCTLRTQSSETLSGGKTSEGL